MSLSDVPTLLHIYGEVVLLVNYMKWFTEFAAAFYQGMLSETNKKMAVSLQDKSVFSLLGHCSADISTNGPLEGVGMGVDDRLNSSTSKNANLLDNPDIFGNNFGQCTSDFPKLDGLRHQNSPIGNNWVQLVCHSSENFGSETFWIPKLHHIRWNGRIESQCDVHVCKSWILLVKLFVLCLTYFPFRTVFGCGC